MEIFKYCLHLSYSKIILLNIRLITYHIFAFPTHIKKSSVNFSKYSGLIFYF